MSVVPLDGVIRGYDWGSTTAIQTMLGIRSDGTPAAELWFGDHPGGPSPAGDSTLDRLIAADPAALLGAGGVERFGPRLPFLLKVLAAERPLSIQVHPNLAQARAGYAAEEAAGIPRDARARNYADPNHKPELLCALSEFEALCGFRPVAQTLGLLAEIALPELDFVVARLREPDGLRAAFTAVLTHERPERLAAAVAAAARPDGPLRPAYLAAREFPGDIGIVLTLLLNHVRLEPGQAVFLGAGNVHAYLRGTGVEIMANSDNVLRCGLTPKHIDVPELLRIADFGELADPVWPAHPSDVGSRFVVPVPDFGLTRIALGDAQRLAAGSPRIVLCTDGRALVDSVPLSPGHAAFVPAAEAVTVSGDGTVFVGATG